MTLWKTNQSINQWSCINKWLLIQLNREITSIFKFCTAKWLMTWKTGSRLISVNSLPHRKSHVASGGSNKFRAAKSLNHLKYFCIKILHNAEMSPDGPFYFFLAALWNKRFYISACLLFSNSFTCLDFMMSVHRASWKQKLHCFIQLLIKLFLFEHAENQLTNENGEALKDANSSSLLSHDLSIPSFKTL